MEVVGLWSVNESTSHFHQEDVGTWYRQTFGLWNFIKFCAYACAIWTGRLIRGHPMTFSSLCRRQNTPYWSIQNPDDPQLHEWLSEQQVDVLVILTSHILKEPLLSKTRLGILNQHTALLPSYRGLFPYFWASIDKAPQGITIHLVDQGIDTGAVICRESIRGKPTQSMSSFYAHADQIFPDLLVQAVSRLNQGSAALEPLPQIQESYKGKPKRSDYLKFQKAGGKITRLRDVFRALTWG